jgi:hypothetical protein
MAAITLKIEHLVLDTDNPRIRHSESQQQTLQRVVKDQGTKLVRLAESIVEHGLSPIDRLMVLEISDRPKRYVALEGNRRVAALKLLVNPAAMSGLDIKEGVRRGIERLVKIFDKSKVEPIDCFEVSSREEGRHWIELRHNGEDQGRGVVGWKPIVAARFREKEPAIQALDMVLEHGGFTEDQAEEIRSGFNLTTLRRVMEAKEALALLGLRVEDKQLLSSISGSELIKPLRKIVQDIANKEKDSRSFNKNKQIVEYINGFSTGDKPNLKKTISERPVEGIDRADFSKAAKQRTRTKKSRSEIRTRIVPKNCPIHVTDNRISEIYEELSRTLKLDDARNAISVVLRVFLELSVDHFLEKNGKKLTKPRHGGGELFRSLDEKVEEAINVLVSVGVNRNKFNAVIRSLSDKKSPLHDELLHAYVHDRFQTPSPHQLTAAWDHAQPLFEHIWPVE